MCRTNACVCRDAETCLGYFGERRTDRNAGSAFQGVETPSQVSESRGKQVYERKYIGDIENFAKFLFCKIIVADIVLAFSECRAV